MFAVIKTGGKQYKVSPGDIIKVEKLDSQVGSKIDFSSIMLIGDQDATRLGSPLIDTVTVSATVLEQKRSRKIIVYKKKRRQGYDRKKGHRQFLSVIHIDEISENGQSLLKAQPYQPRPQFDNPVVHHHMKHISRRERLGNKIQDVNEDLDVTPVEQGDHVKRNKISKATTNSQPDNGDALIDQSYVDTPAPKSSGKSKKPVMETNELTVTEDKQLTSKKKATTKADPKKSAVEKE